MKESPKLRVVNYVFLNANQNETSSESWFIKTFLNLQDARSSLPCSYQLPSDAACKQRMYDTNMISRSFTHQYKLSYYVFDEPNVILALLFLPFRCVLNILR